MYVLVVRRETTNNCTGHSKQNQKNELLASSDRTLMNVCVCMSGVRCMQVVFFAQATAFASPIVDANCKYNTNQQIEEKTKGTCQIVYFQVL